jgi:hypothetical protein
LRKLLLGEADDDPSPDSPGPETERAADGPEDPWEDA